MNITEIIKNDLSLLRETIYDLGFTLAEVSINIYPNNHQNKLSSKFGDQRVTPKDAVLIVDYLRKEIGESVFNQSYNKELERLTKYMESLRNSRKK
ncbi:MAG: hypothetical protein CVV25_03990 [Ignavibacteriae bacterium HGW-Ignavibacteriae-4]|jgi:hypothetical protein|nr:MAG: hypothetical protein CVV25_03990 [Ignavibacteriae bacterium HGW-Ignavibacteriae-4]